MRTLSAANITQSVSEIEAYFDKQGVSSDTIIRSRVALEEILSIYASIFSENKEFDIKFSNRLGQVRCCVSIPGDACDPFNPENEDYQSLVLVRLMLSFSDGPIWSYNEKKVCNEIIFEPFSENSLPRNVKVTWHYLKKYKGRLGKAIFFQLLELVMQIIIPLVSAALVTAYTESIYIQIATMVCVVFALEIINALCYHKYNESYERAYHDAVIDLEADLAKHVHSTNLDSVDSHGTGMFIQRMTVDTVQLISGFGELAEKLGVIAKGVGLLVATLVIDWGAFLITAVSMTVSYLIELRRVNEMNEDDIAYRKANENLFGAVTEMIRGTKDVRVLGCDAPFIENIRTGITGAADAQLEMNEDNLKFHIRREVSDIAWNFLYLAYLGLGMYFGRLTPVVAIILLNYRNNIRDIPHLIGETMHYFKQFNLSAGRIFSLMFNPDFTKESFGEKTFNECEGKIEFKDVSFSYYANSLHKRRKKVLQKVSFTVEAGQTVAFVGKSGCGKSTILNLMEKLYIPGSGKIFLDDENIDMLTLEAIRRNVVMVSQQPYVFSMSIRENLKLVKPDMTEEDMYLVCQTACIHDEILSMPEGYDTLVGENGTSLSGGQCQRLAIARALLRKPKILLLDEATSALDNAVQTQIFKNLSSLPQKHTYVISSHRLSTVTRADKIFYLEEGKIIASGTHDELMMNCEEYRLQYNSHE